MTKLAYDWAMDEADKKELDPRDQMILELHEEMKALKEWATATDKWMNELYRRLASRGLTK